MGQNSLCDKRANGICSIDNLSNELFCPISYFVPLPVAVLSLAILSLAVLSLAVLSSVILSVYPKLMFSSIKQ